MNFRVYERREQRSFLNQGLGFGSIGYTIANYSTDTGIDKKLDMKPFEEDILNRINCIPDPLRKNLADTVISSSVNPKKPEKMPPDPSDFYYPGDFQQEPTKTANTQTDTASALQGITSFFSNFFGAITNSVFHRRPKSPVTDHYDYFDQGSGLNGEMASQQHWQSSRMHDQNKNLAPEHSSVELNDNMNSYRATVGQCEQKLTAVKGLLSSKNVVAPPKFRRRPKKVFVEPGTVQESSEEGFTSDDYVSLPNGEFIEYVSVRNNQAGELSLADAAMLKVEPELHETDIVKVLPESAVKTDLNTVEVGTKLNVNSQTDLKSGKSGLNLDAGIINGQKSIEETANNNREPIALPEIKVGPGSEVKVTPDTSKGSQFNVISDVIEGSKFREPTEGSQAQFTPKTTVESLVQLTPSKSEESEKVMVTPSRTSNGLLVQITPKTIEAPAVKVTPNIIEKTEVQVILNTTDKITTLPEVKDPDSKPVEKDSNVTKQELISSVEDKMAKLKSLLQEKRKKTCSHTYSTDPTEEFVQNTEKPDTDRLTVPVKSSPAEIHKDKRFKNPHRLTEKRKKSKLRRNIQDDMRFAHEVESDPTVSSVENSPNLSSRHLAIPQRKHRCPQKLCKCKDDSPSDCSKTPNTPDQDYFDELKGRFHSSSTTESDDSFQIVFADSPKKIRRPSDCESEDSFIVFEDSPDSCFTSNDVFGDHVTSESESECSDSDTDLSDSGCGPDFKLLLSHNLSRTVSDLTDDSLYEDVKSGEDIVDHALRTFEEIPSKDIHTDVTSPEPKKTDLSAPDTDLSAPDNDLAAKDTDLAAQDTDKPPEDDQESAVTEIQESKDDEKTELKHGLLLDAAKKLLRKDQPAKKVSFASDPPQVRVMRVWAFAARQARAGHWERHALDRERFKRRIADVDMAVSWVLKPQHRSRVMFQRFMPWWNHLKRLEIAEKKRLKEEEELREKEEEERRVQEEEERKIREEEERRLKEEEEKRIKEEEERRKESGETVEDKVGTESDVDTVGSKSNTQNTDTANEKVKNGAGKHKLYNSNYNKPRSAYLKQATNKKTPNTVNNKNPTHANISNSFATQNSTKTDINKNVNGDKVVPIQRQGKPLVSNEPKSAK